MNHILFNRSTTDPNKAPRQVEPDGGLPYDADRARGFGPSPIENPQFHAQRMHNELGFLCDRCGGPVRRMPGRVGTEQLPRVMYCNVCDLTSGGWQTEEEQERFLQSMTAG